MRERDVERYLVTQVTRMGGEVRKVQWIGRSGAPDRVMFFPDGFCAWVELKRPGGRLSSHQAREHKRLRDMRQKVFVISSKEAVDNTLTGLYGVGCVV